MVTALQGQNAQVASAVLNQPPAPQRACQIAVRTLGRLVDPKKFAEIVVKQTAVVRLKDVGRNEPSAVDYATNSCRDLDPAVALADFDHQVAEVQRMRNVTEMLVRVGARESRPVGF